MCVVVYECMCGGCGCVRAYERLCMSVCGCVCVCAVMCICCV